MSAILPTKSDTINLVQEAYKLSPNKMGELDGGEKGSVDNFLKAAELWEKGAEVISKLPQDQIPQSYELSLYSDSCFKNDRHSIVSACYTNAAKCLLSAQYKELLNQTINVGHSVDKKIQELFKKALLEDKLIDTSKMDLYWQLRHKEYSLLTFKASAGSLGRHEPPNLEKIQRVKDKIYRKELKLAQAFEQIAKDKEYDWDHKEWRCLMNAAHHLLIAGRLAPTPEKKQAHLLRAELIGRKIWFEYENPHSTCFPEFNPDRSHHVEGTVIGMIQQELNHCKRVPFPFSNCVLVEVDIRFEKKPEGPIQLW